MTKYKQKQVQEIWTLLVDIEANAEKGMVEAMKKTEIIPDGQIKRFDKAMENLTEAKWRHHKSMSLQAAFFDLEDAGVFKRLD